MIENSTIQKKVCHVTSAHHRYDIRIFHKECKSLASNGFDVTLLVNDNLPDESIDGVKIKSTQFKPKNRYQRMVKSRKHIERKLIEIDADIYHLHDPELLLLVTWLRKNNKKVIYDSHEDVPRQILSKEWIPRFVRKFISDFFEILENSIVKKIDGIVTPTPHIENRFSKINSNVCQISNFPLLGEFEDSKEKKLKEIQGCYLGGISKNRGVYNICEAMRRNNLVINLCGKFTSLELKDEVLKEYSNVKYHGVQDRDGVINVLKNSSFGFVTLYPTPNHINSYPIKMFEYMAAGIPVIASNFDLWREIIEKNNCGICVNPYDINEITEAIEHLINDKDKMDLMGENGKKAIFNRYNWTKEEEKLLHFYLKIGKTD